MATARKAPAPQKRTPAQQHNGRVSAPAEPTDIGEWKKSSSTFTTLTVPTGKNMRVKRVALETLIAAGKVPNSLLPMMRNASKGQKTEVNQDNVTEQQIVEMLALMDSVVCDISVQPKVHPAPADELERRDDLLYVDELESQDKGFLFQWAVGGTSDVAKFRDQLSERMGALSASEGMGEAS
jgi:hypothetical protein